MSKQGNRIQYWDIVKGIAITFVVWGHVIQFGGANIDIFKNKVFIFIYSFHMPLFMLVSGYFLAKSNEKRNYWENLKKKICHIVLPAIIGGVAYFVVKFIVEKLLGNAGYDFSLQNIINEIEDIWFLWSVFMCSVVVMTAKKIAREGKGLAFLLVMGYVVLCFLPYSRYNVYLYPYFVFGYYWDKYKIKNINILECLSIIIFPIMLQFYNEKHFIYTTGVDLINSEYGVMGQINIDIFRWIIGFFGCFVIILFSKMMSYQFGNARLIKFIEKIGCYTLEIYLIHRIVVIYLGNKIMWKLVNDLGITYLGNENIYSLIFAPIFTVLFIAMIYFMITVVKYRRKNENCK
jgi:fucose 4-O-acetylase-like acetyltransferase